MLFGEKHSFPAKNNGFLSKNLFPFNLSPQPPGMKPASNFIAISHLTPGQDAHRRDRRRIIGE
jgi:hypothetical protein